MTSNPQAAEAFYSDVIGRRERAFGVPHLSYTMFTQGEPTQGGPAAGLAETNARPGWLGYVEVDDVDAGASLAVGKGGLVRRVPTDIPGIGRFAVISDPQGGTLALFKPLGNAPETRPPADSVGWHELHAGDRDAAMRFYAGLFGWTTGEQLDLGVTGLYQLFAHGSDTIGGMMTKRQTIPRPFWLFYFAVEAIQPAIERVRDAGGEVLNGPHQVPAGSWIAQCMDPQGGLFALVAPKMELSPKT